MIVQLFDTKTSDPKEVEVHTFTDIQRLVGGHVAVATTVSGQTLLCNEDGLPLGLKRCKAFPALVGKVVLAPAGWDDLPFGQE